MFFLYSPSQVQPPTLVSHGDMSCTSWLKRRMTCWPYVMVRVHGSGEGFVGNGEGGMKATKRLSSSECRSQKARERAGGGWEQAMCEEVPVSV